MLENQSKLTGFDKFVLSLSAFLFKNLSFIMLALLFNVDVFCLDKTVTHKQ